jgi:UDP-N-acetylglucosamine--N-acetylmuramyl-(pentapeptide) pyrophosphoryl-undecaprenol N-acetylglucosamine transferase
LWSPWLRRACCSTYRRIARDGWDGKHGAVKVIIAAGGTGGHLYPGIAVAREVLREAGSEAIFVGTEQGIEARVLPLEGLPVRFINVGRIKGMRVGSVLRTLAMLPKGVLQSLRLLRAERPAAVIGVGGYASGPVALAAWLLRIPLLIVEPNSHAGLANRVLGRFAKKIFVCFPGRDRQGFFPEGKKILTGPLVRKGMDAGDRDAALAAVGLETGRFTVLVMGGSGGAHAINMAMKEAAADLAGLRGLQVLHQTGEKDASDVAEAYRAAGIQAAVVPYIHDMAGAYALADMVVCRAGATTVAELAVCGKRAVLIPYPFAADNHQEHNARSLAERGDAEVIVQKDLTPLLLAGAIRRGMTLGRVVAAMPSTAAEEITRVCRTYVQED